MQPGVTVALATVWLAVVAGVVGAVTPRPLRLSHDQYSPASPSRDGAQQDQAWRDHDLAKDQPLDSWIGSQRSISAEGKFDLAFTVHLLGDIVHGSLKKIDGYCKKRQDYSRD